MSSWEYFGQDMECADYQYHTETDTYLVVGRCDGEVVSFPVEYRYGLPEGPTPRPV